MNVRAVVVPGPPLLLPELTGPVATAAEPVRAACAQAVSWLVDDGLQQILAVGIGARTHRHPAGAWGTTGGFGAEVRAPQRAAGSQGCPPGLPFSLTLAARLLDLADWRGPLVLQEVAADAVPGECLALGRSLAEATSAGGVGWLVVADGTTRRAERSPGGFDPRAEALDAEVTAALAEGSAERLAQLDPVLTAELGVTGRAAVQVLAGSCGPAPTGRITYAEAPFGVGYVVACWGWG